MPLASVQGDSEPCALQEQDGCQTQPA